jgi:WD40 repeat protein
LTRWFQPEHTKTYTAVVPSPDGQLLAATSTDDHLRVWNSVTGTLLYEREVPHDATPAAFSPDGQWIALGDDEQNLHLFQTATGWKVWQKLNGNSVNATGFSRDGTIIYYVNAVGELVGCNFSMSVKFVVSVTGGSSLDHIATSPRGDLLAVGGTDTGGGAKIYIRRASNGTAVRTLTGLTGGVKGLFFTPDGAILYAADESGHIHKWNPYTTNTTGISVKNLPSGVIEACLSPDGKSIAASCVDATLRIVQLKAGFPFTTADLPIPDATVCFAPDGSRIYFGGTSSEIYAYDPVSKVFAERLRLGASPVAALDWRPDASSISYTESRTYQGMKSTDGSLIESWSSGGKAKCVRYSPKNNLLAVGTTVNNIRLKNLATDMWLQPLSASGMRDVDVIDFAPSGKQLACGGSDFAVWIWSLDGTSFGQVKTSLVRHTANITGLCYSKDGKLLVSGDALGKVNFWTGGSYAFKTSLNTLPAPVKDLRYHPLNKYLGVSFADKVRLYNPPTDTTEPSLFKEFETPDGSLVADFGFSVDGKTVLIGSENGKVYFEPIASGNHFQTGSFGILTRLSVSPGGDAIAIGTTTGVGVVGNPFVSWLGTIEAFRYGATGGSSIPLVLRFTAPTPIGGAFVSLSSDQTFLQVPSTVYVPFGEDAIEVYARCSPMSAPGSGTIKATYKGRTLSVPIYVLPPYALSVAYNATSVKGGQPVTATVTISGPAPAGGLTVGLKSTANVDLPSSTITIPAGATSASFEADTADVNANATASITATTFQVQKTSLFRLTP